MCIHDIYVKVRIQDFFLGGGVDGDWPNFKSNTNKKKLKPLSLHPYIILLITILSEKKCGELVNS